MAQKKNRNSGKKHNKHIQFVSPEPVSSSSLSRTIEEDDSITLGEEHSYTEYSTEISSSVHPSQEYAANREDIIPDANTIAPTVPAVPHGGPPTTNQTSTSKPPRTWANVVKNLNFDDLKIDSYTCNDEVITLEQSDIYDVSKKWGNCLLGCFQGRWPGFENIKKLINYWNVDCSLIPHYNNCVIFRFTRIEDMEAILVGRPFHCMGQPFLLKKLTLGASFSKEELRKIPVWVKFPQLPLECWHRVALGKISSKIGKPIRCDQATTDLKFNACARVLIEVDASKILPSSSCVKLPNGGIFEQKFELDHVPKFCLKRSYCGHLSDNCNGLLKKRGKVTGKKSTDKPDDPISHTSDSLAANVVCENIEIPMEDAAGPSLIAASAPVMPIVNTIFPNPHILDPAPNSMGINGNLGTTSISPPTTLITNDPSPVSTSCLPHVEMESNQPNPSDHEGFTTALTRSTKRRELGKNKGKEVATGNDRQTSTNSYTTFPSVNPPGKNAALAAPGRYIRPSLRLNSGSNIPLPP